MQRKPGAPQGSFPATGFIKTGRPFPNSSLSKKDTSPFPLEDTTSQAWDPSPSTPMQAWDPSPSTPMQTWDQFSTSRKSALKGLAGTRKDIPNKSLFQRGKNYWSQLPRKRRILLSVVSAVLAVVIVVGVIGATFVQNLLNSQSPLAAPPTIQVSIDALALHNLLAQAVNPAQDSVSDINIVPMPDNSIKISLTMLISGVSGPGVNRKLPMELDATLGGTTGPNKNILTVTHFVRDG
ncbi:MAG TPA: hypothetical protein VH593_31290, partial [Ktedonobacteraceae bacterium]